MVRLALIQPARAGIFIAAVTWVVACDDSARADIFRWDNGALIPGTEGITPGPGVSLDGASLQFADLRNLTLTDASFQSADLSDAKFDDSVMTGVKLYDALVDRASFARTTSRGFTYSQLFFTRSYRVDRLSGVDLSGNDLSGWHLGNREMGGTDFSESNLTEASFLSAGLKNANFENANLQGARLTVAQLSSANFQGANLTDAFITAAELSGTVLTKEQFYSTASYMRKNLGAIGLGGYNLSGWDFSGQQMVQVDLRDSNLAGANITAADLSYARNFTKQQLYSTANHQQRNLSGIGLRGIDFTGWDLTDQNLASANLIDAKLGQAILRSANLTGAEVRRASFNGALAFGFTKEQLYSTGSYQAHDLTGVGLADNDLTGWDFTGQNLRSASLENATLSGASLVGAVIAGVNLNSTVARGFTKEQLYGTRSYQAHDLLGIGLRSNDLTGWNLAGQDLRQADLVSATLAGVDLSLADLRAATGFVPAASTVLRNTILPDGAVKGLALQPGDALVVHDDAVNVNVDSHFSMADNSVLKLVVGYRAGEPMISIGEGVQPQLGGTLILESLPRPAIGHVPSYVDLFDWPSALEPTNRFAHIETAPGTYWDLSRLYTTGVVGRLLIPEPTTLALALCGMIATVIVALRSRR